MMDKLKKEHVANSVCRICGKVIHNDGAWISEIKFGHSMHLSCYLNRFGFNN